MLMGYIEERGGGVQQTTLLIVFLMGYIEEEGGGVQQERVKLQLQQYPSVSNG